VKTRRIEIREKRALIIYSQNGKDINLDQPSITIGGGR